MIGGRMFTLTLNRKHEISIGSMEENPVPITDHDIHGKTIWLQDGVFAGKQANGYWEIFVESEGDYLTNEKGDITAVNFRLHLIKGSTRMSAWFVDGANDGEVFGVYYVYVKKLI